MKNIKKYTEKDIEIMIKEFFGAHLILDLKGIPRQCGIDEVSEGQWDVWTYNSLIWRIKFLIEQNNVDKLLDSLNIPKDFEGVDLTLEQRKEIIKNRINNCNI